jgi:DNA-binding response OmpR family regulator
MLQSAPSRCRATRDDYLLALAQAGEAEVIGPRLLVRPSRVHEKRAPLRAVWDYRAAGSTRTLDSHASRLRRKPTI